MKFKVPSKLAFLVLLPCLFAAQSSSAQIQSSASLNGVVKDSTGAVISDATITLTSVETGISQAKETNGAGLYEFSNILPGPHTRDSGPNSGQISPSM